MIFFFDRDVPEVSFDVETTEAGNHHWRMLVFSLESRQRSSRNEID